MKLYSKKDMRILLITDDFYPKTGGISNVLLNLYKAFQKRKEYQFFVVNPFCKGKNVYRKLKIMKIRKLDYFKFFFKDKNLILLLYIFWKIIFFKKIKFSYKIKIIIYFIIKPNILIKTLENLKILYPFIKKKNFDIIISGNSGWIFPLNFLLSIILKKKILTMAHGLDFLVKSRFSLKTYFFRAADKIIVTNNQTKRLIKKIHNLNENKIKVIYIGVNLKDLEISGSKEELRNQFNIPLDLKMILSVGRHVARKNFDLVIRAIKEIKIIRPNLKIKYYLIGEGPKTNQLKKIVKELKLEKNVEFLGRCDVNTRNKFYKMSDIFIMPSITRKKDIEGFGLVFLEANYFKVPVIGTKSGGIVEAVIDGVTGFLIEQNNLNELIEKILILLDNEELRSKLGENGQKRVIKNFQWDFLINDYVNLFKEYMD